jgi:DNA-binding winged helix-turn-helix (wHTH) protein
MIKFRGQTATFCLDTDAVLLLSGNQRIDLPGRQYELLKYLVEHPGKLVTWQELRDDVWNGANVNDEAISRVLYLLRKKLGYDHPSIIETKRGYGVRFIGEVEPNGDQPPPSHQPRHETTGGVLAGRLSMSRIHLSFSEGCPRLNWEWGGWEGMPPHLIALIVAATVIENDTLPQLHRPSRAKFTFSSPSGLTQAEANISFTSDHLMFEVEKTYGGQDGFVLANPTKEVLRLLWKADVRSELAYERIAATDVGEIGNGRGATYRNYVEMRVPLL